MNPKEEEWKLSAQLVKRMFADVAGADLAPSIRCPICTDPESAGVPHMRETVFGGVDDSTSGPGLIIKFYCENDHEWQLRFVDHSGGTWLSVT